MSDEDFFSSEPVDRRTFLRRGLGLGAFAAAATSVDADEPPKLSTTEKDAEKKAVMHCMDIMRGCQLPNGAINMRMERNPTGAGDIAQAIDNDEVTDKDGKHIEKKKVLAMIGLEPTVSGDDIIEALKNKDTLKKIREDKDIKISRKNDTIRVVPYFANFVALSMLSGYENHTHDPRDMERVAKWLKFYADHQHKDTGYIPDFKGSIKKGTFEVQKDEAGEEVMDSVDAYASTQLQIADRYWQLRKKMPAAEQVKLDKIISKDELSKSSKLSLQAIVSVTKEDGLTIAKPTYPFKYTLDNLEVYGGLVAGQRFFKEVGVEYAATAEVEQKEDDKIVKKKITMKGMDIANKIAKKMPDYWLKDEKHFAWAMDEEGAMNKEMDASYPGALVNLCCCAWLGSTDKKEREELEKGKKELFEEIKKKFKPDEHNPPERWLMAAIGVGDPDVKDWHLKTVKEAQSFDRTTNVHRPAVAMLSLLEGRSWMPSVAEPSPRQGQNK